MLETVSVINVKQNVVLCIIVFTINNFVNGNADNETAKFRFYNEYSDDDQHLDVWSNLLEDWTIK